MCNNYCVTTPLCYDYSKPVIYAPTYVTTTASTEKPMYLSGDFNLNGNKVYIREVIYNAPATIVIWNDGTKTVCKCAKGDIYSRETGLSICILKKLVGATKIHDVFEDWVGDNEKRVTLKDVRKKSR